MFGINKEKASTESQAPSYTEKEEIDTAQTLLYSDTPLTPKMISSLMHVGVSITSTYAYERQEERSLFLKVFEWSLLVIVSVSLAALIGGAFLYAHGIGPFAEAKTIVR